MGAFKFGALIEQTAATVTSGTPVTLVKNSKTFQRFTGSTVQTVNLPDATTMAVGQKFVFENRSSALLLIVDGGGSFLSYVAPNSDRAFQLYSIGTAAGTWDVGSGPAGYPTPLRMYANAPATSVLNFAPSKTSTLDGTELVPSPISNLVPSAAASTIDFQAGTTTGTTFTGLLPFPSTTVGNYIRVGFTLLSNGNISAAFTAQNASLGSLADPGTLFTGSGTPLGYVDLQATATTAFRTAGSSSSVIEAAPGGTPAIHVFAAGGSGGGSSGISGTIVNDTSTGSNVVLSNWAFAKRITGALSSIAGVTATSGVTGLYLLNRTGNAVTIFHNSSAAGAGNAILNPGDVDISIAPDEMVFLLYNTTDSAWDLQRSDAAEVSVNSANSIVGLSASDNRKTVMLDTTTGSSYINLPAPNQNLKFAALDKAGQLSVNKAVVQTTGIAYGVGLNTSGTIGDGSLVTKSSPVLTVGGLRLVQIASGFSTYGITAGGIPFSWGSNSNGSLGDGTIAAKSSPVQVVGGLAFIQVAAGTNASGYGLTVSGDIYAWGNNSAGQLGDNTVVSKSSPVKVVGGLKFVQVAGGGNTGYGLTSSGALYAWGTNTAGQLGDNTSVAKSSPVLVVGGLSFRSIAAGNISATGITVAGDAYSWGANTAGILGDGSTTTRTSPSIVVGGLKFVQVAVGSTACSAITTGGVYSWGGNTSGELGDNTVVAKSSPVQVVGGLSFVSVSAGNGNASALTSAGVAYSWGTNSDGRLGSNNVTNQSSPVQVVGGLAFTSLSAGSGGTTMFLSGSTVNGLINPQLLEADFGQWDITSSDTGWYVK